jgi:hypothetical protein
MRAARMFVKTWRILTKLRTDPARATNLRRALRVLANLVVNRSRPGTAAHQLHEHLRTLPPPRLISHFQDGGSSLGGPFSPARIDGNVPA